MTRFHPGNFQTFADTFRKVCHNAGRSDANISKAISHFEANGFDGLDWSHWLLRDTAKDLAIEATEKGFTEFCSR